jgi:ABC-type branched-subunit amino acid transport system substrate-binding protein
VNPEEKNMFLRGYRGVIAVVLAMALTGIAVTACGGGSSSSTPTESTTPVESGNAKTSTTSAKEPTGTPIKIGQIAPVNTATLDFSDMRAGAAAAAIGINKAGGIDGHPVEVLFCNEQGNANAAAACARKLISEGVVSIAGSLSFTGEQQIAELTEKAGIVMVGNNGLAGGGFASAENNYPFQSLIFEELAAAPACSNAGLNKIATSTSGGGVEEFYEAPVEAQIASLPEAELVSTGVVVETTATDVSAPLKKIVDAEPQCIIVIWFPSQTTLAINTLQQFGSEAKISFSTAAMSSEEIEQLGSTLDAHGLGFGSYPQPSTAEQFNSMKQFRGDMQAEAETGDNDAPTGDYVRTEAVEAWLSVRAIAKVMEEAKVTDGAGLAKAMKTIKNVEIADFLPPWTPNTPGVAGYTHMPFTEQFIYAFEGGKPVLQETIDVKPYLKYLE